MCLEIFGIFVVHPFDLLLRFSLLILILVLTLLGYCLVLELSQVFSYLCVKFICKSLLHAARIGGSKTLVVFFLNICMFYHFI